MINLYELLKPNCFVNIEKPTSKKMVYETLCNKLHLDYKICKSHLLNELIDRDRKGITTIGNGIAIPFIQINSISNPICIVSVLSNGLDFDAVDQTPVDVIFLLILPQINKSENLQTLAIISRLLRNSDLITKLRGSRSQDSAFAIITEYLKNRAA